MAELSISPDPTAIMGRRAFAALLDVIVCSLAAVGSVLGFGKRIDESTSGASVRDMLDFVRDEQGNLLLRDGRPQLSGFTRVLDLGDTTFVFQGWLRVLGAYAVPLTVIFAIGVLAQGRTGATLGKAICGVRTVDELGRLPGFRRSALRTAAWVVDGFPYLVPLVGPLVAFSSAGHQRLGDRLGGTFVVDHAFAGELPDIPGFDPPEVAAEPARSVVFNKPDA